MPTRRCFQGPSAGQSSSARRLVLARWSRAGLGDPGPLPLPNFPRLPPRPLALRSPPGSSRRSSSRGRRSGAGRRARVTSSCDPPAARSTRSGAITPWARWRGGAAELSWPRRGRLYPRPEPQEAVPLPRRGWDGGGHVGGGVQGESLPHPRPAPARRALAASGFQLGLRGWTAPPLTLELGSTSRSRLALVFHPPPRDSSRAPSFSRPRGGDQLLSQTWGRGMRLGAPKALVSEARGSGEALSRAEPAPFPREHPLKSAKSQRGGEGPGPTEKGGRPGKPGREEEKK